MELQWLRKRRFTDRLLALAHSVLSKRNGPGWGYTFRLLREHNLTPATVFDIGVAKGTPRLYTAFPDALFHLIDPTQESLPFMEDIAERYHAVVHNVALGDKRGDLEIIVREGIGASSFLADVADPTYVRRYQVPVIPFDELPVKITRPALAKIDVQGTELHVLSGMKKSLHLLDAIIIEASTIATVVDGPELRDIIDFMSRYHWSLYDVMTTERRPLDGALAQMDLMFVPNDSPLRSDKRWS